ncbi:hypothetical protein IPF89_04460 [Candidatus Saccharibacteria bacterium]|nr:MAG: hypothetical protein IPF89_04460 [Candidatus Saccharibacteria bacterium]
MLSKASSKANSRIGKKWNDTSMLGAMSQQRQRNQQLKRAQTLGGHGNGLGAKYYKGINRLTGKNYGGKLSAHGAGVAAEMEKKKLPMSRYDFKKDGKKKLKSSTRPKLSLKKLSPKVIPYGPGLPSQYCWPAVREEWIISIEGIVNAEGKRALIKAVQRSKMHVRP